MKKIVYLFAFLLLIQNYALSQTVYDDSYQENPNYIQGIKYIENSQYSSAINEFKKAIRVNPKDDSSLIGLSNAYNLRAEYYNNTAKATDNAISDLKSALFFLKYFPDNNDFTSSQSIIAIEKNLALLESASGQKISNMDRYTKAKYLRTKGEFAAAGYDFHRLISIPEYQANAATSLGDIYKIFNLPKKAVIYYKKAIDYEPENADNHLKLARAYEQLNEYTAAIEEYSYAMENSSEKEEILSSLEKIWQKKVDEFPKNAEAHSNLGVVYQKQKRYKEALLEYKRAEALNPENINIKINIGTLYQEQGNLNYAITEYNTILESQPLNADIILYKAQCLKKLNKNEEAIEQFNKVLEIDKTNSIAKAELFELIKNTMPTDAVLEYMQKNVKSSPANADAYYEFAYELHKSNKIDDAIVYYNQTIKLNPENIDAYINLSQAYRQNQKYSDALSIIKKAKDKAPNNELVTKQYETAEKEFNANNYTLASNEFQSGNYQSAIEKYSQIIPQTSESLIGIAASYQSLKNTVKAIEYYKKAMDLDSKNDEIPVYIASIYASLNSLEDTKQNAKAALARNSSNAQAKELLEYVQEKEYEKQLSEAMKLYEEKKYKEAVVILDKVIKNTTENSSAYYYRALAYDGLNNYQNAISDYKAVIKYAPEMAIAYYSIAIDYDAVENYKAAKENYKKYIDLTLEDNDYKQYAKARVEEIK